jgi:molecular chaperone DnaK
VEARNQAESLIHSTEKALAEHGDKLNPADKSLIETALSELKSAQAGDDIGQTEAKTRALSQASMKIGEAAAQQAQAGAGGSSGQSEAKGAGGNDDVIDAEFEEVDDRKRSSR